VHRAILQWTTTKKKGRVDAQNGHFWAHERCYVVGGEE
jgi:hypothetical protein